jgi:uncharacterized protein YchJ
MKNLMYIAAAIAGMAGDMATTSIIPDFDDKPTPKRWRYAKQRKAEDIPLAGRNEPCPCGSEKKYKKCCLK